MYVETGDMTAHGEIVVLRDAASRLSKMNEDEKWEITLYSTLEPCLMCIMAISFVDIRRVVYSALSEVANGEEMMVSGITCGPINDLLTREPIERDPGVRREKGRELLAQMGKLRK
jgi:tRNA(adenine34) deaminase